MDANLVPLPPGVEARFQKALADRGLPADDPLAELLRAQVIMADMQNRRALREMKKQIRFYACVFFFLFTPMVGGGSYFFCHWNESQETLKTRPIIAVNSPGLAVMYGTKAGKRIITVTSGKDKIVDAWPQGGVAYIVVQ